MSRPPRPVFAGATYHLTARGNNDELIFIDDADRYAYLVLLARALRTMAVRLFAYALMSTHVHLAVQTTLPNIPATIRWLHTRYAKRFNRRHGRNNHLFGDRYYSKVITDDLYLLEVTQYLHLNPVLAGIVAHPANYPWTSYRAYVSPNPQLVDVGPVLGIFSHDMNRSRSAYARFIGDRLTRLRRAGESLQHVGPDPAISTDRRI